MEKVVLEKATVLSGILMESIFLLFPAGTLWKCMGKKNHFAVITVIYIREQHWIDQNVRFQGNNSTLTIIIIHLKGNFWASKLMGKNGLILLWW